MVMRGLFPLSGHSPRQRRSRSYPLEAEQLTPTEVNPRMVLSSGRVRKVWEGAGDNNVVEEESTCPEIPSLREQTLVDHVPEFIADCSTPVWDDATIQDAHPEPTSPYLSSPTESRTRTDDTETDTCPFLRPRAVSGRGAGTQALPLPPLLGPASRTLDARPRGPAAAAQPTAVTRHAPACHVDTLPIAGRSRSERVCTTDQIELELDEDSVCAPRTRGWVRPLLLTGLLAACGAAYLALQLGVL